MFPMHNPAVAASDQMAADRNGNFSGPAQTRKTAPEYNAIHGSRRRSDISQSAATGKQII
jgi:hypothetical protein